MAYMKTRLFVEILLKYNFWVFLYIKVVDIVEEDICFAAMLYLVSRDPFFQIWQGYCWVSCAEAVFCTFVRLKGWEEAPFQESLNDNTLAAMSNYRGLFSIIQMQIITWKRGKNLFSVLKSLQLALRAVILS